MPDATEDRSIGDMLNDVYASTAANPVPGGCDHCEAEQRVVPVSDGIWSLSIIHDDDCPFLIHYQNRGTDQRAEQARQALQMQQREGDS